MTEVRKSRTARAFYLTVCSGKGGVGKSTLAVLLAAKLSDAGKRTLLIDADTGLGDLALLTNAVVRRGFESVLAGTATLNDAVTKINPRLWLIGTESGQRRALDPASERGLRICSELDALFDVVVIDTPSSLDSVTLTLAAYSDLSAVVSTPRIPAVADAYTQLKQALQINPRLSAGVVINRVESDIEGIQASTKFAELVERFLKTNIAQLGIVDDSALLTQAAESQALLTFAQSQPAPVRKLDSLVKTLLENYIARPRRTASLWSAFGAAISIKPVGVFDDTGLTTQILTINESK